MPSQFISDYVHVGGGWSVRLRLCLFVHIPLCLFVGITLTSFLSFLFYISMDGNMLNCVCLVVSVCGFSVPVV